MSLHKMQVSSWGFLIALTAGAWIFHSVFLAWSVLIGGLIAIFSFWVTHKDVTRFFCTLTVAEQIPKKADKKNKAEYIIKFWVRIAIIGIVLLILIKYKKVNIFGLILGLSTVVFGVTFTAMNAAWRYFISGRR
jgi:uncharacterized membrane protein